MSFLQQVKKKYSNFDKITIIVFTLSYMLLLLYQRYLPFSDESDNILGGLSIARGSNIYSGFFSQHTPFVYYFASIFSFLGAREYETYRFWMSITILVIWVLMYFRYKNVVGKNAIRIFVLVYPLSVTFHWGQMMLSDVFQGFALLFLLIEFLKFVKLKVITIDSIFVISACIFISLMSAFVSIYSLFVLFLGFLIYAWQKKLISPSLIKNYKKNILYVAIVVAPFLLFFIGYYAIGNLRNFYEQAYVFNRVYYSKYISGFGSSSIAPFTQTLVTWINHISLSILNFNLKNPFVTLLVIFNLIFVGYFYKKDKLLAFILFFYIGFTGMRGFTDFHAAPYYFVSLFTFAFIVNRYLIEKGEEISANKKTILQLLVFLVSIAIMPSYLQNAGVGLDKEKGNMIATAYDQYTVKLTKPTDKVWYGILIPQSYIKNHRQPASRLYSIVPWIADAYSNMVIDDLKKNKPKLIIFDPKEEIWGYKLGNFAASIFDFINANYTPLNPDDDTEKNVYILNAYYHEAQNKMWPPNFNIKNGTLVTDSVNVYIIENRRKRHILSPAIFESYGYKWANVKPYNKETLDNIRTGKPVDKLYAKK